MTWLAISLGFLLGFFAAALLSSSKIEDLENQIWRMHDENFSV